MKLKKKIVYKGVLKALTGVHIGGTNSSMGIGGPDKMVIRNPITNQPYVPGSSIKGKMRSLIEVLDGTVTEVRMGNVKNGPSKDHDTRSVKLFGSATGDDNQRPSRLQVRDASLTEEWQDAQKFGATDLPYTESKTEVVIDRITSGANPRQIERVPAGAEFDLNMVLNVFDEDNEEELRSTLEEAIQLLRDDYLGGNGSRGYGYVEITMEPGEVRDGNYYKERAREILGK